jgi:hypothetical protein
MRKEAAFSLEGINLSCTWRKWGKLPKVYSESLVFGSIPEMSTPPDMKQERYILLDDIILTF